MKKLQMLNEKQYFTWIMFNSYEKFLICLSIQGNLHHAAKFCSYYKHCSVNQIMAFATPCQSLLLLFQRTCWNCEHLHATILWLFSIAFLLKIIKITVCTSTSKLYQVKYANFGEKSAHYLKKTNWINRKYIYIYICSSSIEPPIK